jgi:hypothetical protein
MIYTKITNGNIYHKATYYKTTYFKMESEGDCFTVSNYVML